MTTGLEYFIGKKVQVKIDRPIGSKHPKWGFIYELNYGFIPDTKAADGEEIDAYILGEDSPIHDFTGKVIAIIQRKNDNEDKLVVAPLKSSFDIKTIEEKVKFQEKYFKSTIQT